MYHFKTLVTRSILIPIMLMLSGMALAQPDVTVGSGATQPGGTATIPVSFTNNGQVVGLNFDITYDTTVVASVDLTNCNGNNMNPGGVTCNNPAPGTISIAVATFPLANIASTQIGTIDFTVSGTAALAPTTLTVANASFSNSAAAAVAAGTITNGTITVQAAPAPALTVAPTSATFTAANGSTETKSFTVTNTGNADGLTVTAALSGTNASNYSIASNNCPTASPGVAQGATCTIQVTFAPNAVGAFNDANLALTSNGGNATVDLDGTGTPGPAGALSITPAPFNFGELLTNDESLTQAFTITNTGQAGSSVDTLTFAGAVGQFSSVLSNSNTCGTLAPLEKDESCTYLVKFTPTADGVATATLTVSGVDGNGDTKTATSALSGTGVTEARPSANPVSGTSQSEIVGPEGSHDFTVIFGNNGNTGYTVSCALGNDDDATIWAVTGGGSTTVAADATHTVTTTCTLPDTETYTATLSCSVGQETFTYNYECVGLPPLPIPVDNKWALALLALMMLMAASFGFRFIARQ